MKKQFVLTMLIILGAVALLFAIDKLFLSKKGEIEQTQQNREVVIPTSGVPRDPEHSKRVAEQATSVKGTVISITTSEIEVTDSEGNKQVRKLTAQTYYERMTIPQKLETNQTFKREKLNFEDIKVGDTVQVVSDTSQVVGMVSIIVQL